MGRSVLDVARTSTYFSELTWTQQFDGALPAILANLAGARELNEAVIEYVQDGASAAGPVTIVQLRLGEVLFSSLSLSGSDSGVGASVSINFLTMEQTTWTPQPKGSIETSFGYDLTKQAQIPAKVDKTDTQGNFFGAGLLKGARESSANLPPVAAPIPEPQTWAMMLAGLGVLLGAARRRLRRAGSRAAA